MKPNGASSTVMVMAFMWSATLLPAHAQEATRPRSAQPNAVERPATPPIDVNRLPLDLQRLERQLRQSTERQEHEGLRLRYFVDVYGRAPRIELFGPEESLTIGPVPWGAPTHQEMLQHMTPQEFRAPAMDFNGFMRWLQEKLGK